MTALQLKKMTEEKAVAVVVSAGFTVSRVAVPGGGNQYRVVDTHGVAKLFTPSELRRSAWLWS